MRLIHTLTNPMAGGLKHHAVAWFVACVGIALSAIGFHVTGEQIAAQKIVEFHWVAHNRSRLLKKDFENALESIMVVRDYIQSTDPLEEKSFHRFIGALLARNQGIDAIGLIDQRPTKGAANAAAPGAKRTASRHDALSLTYVQSRGANDFLPGYEIGSQPVLKASVTKALNTGEMAVSGRFKLSGGSGWNYGVMACLPVYQTATSSSIAPALRGIVVAVLRLDGLAHSAISYLEPRGVDLLIEDDSADMQSRFLEFYASRLSPIASLLEPQIQEWLEKATTKLTEVVRMADRDWSITAVPNTYFRSAEAFEEGPWVMLAGGILLTLSLCAYLVRMKLNMIERLKMGRTLRDREQLFWQVAETIDDVFWALPANREEFLYVSPAFESLWGVECQTLYDHPRLFGDAIHPDDRMRWSSALDRATTGAGPVEAIYRVIRPDGTRRWIRDNAFPVRDESGHIYRLVGVAEDITEKKQADDALIDSEHKLRTIFNQSPDTIMTVDRAGDVLLMNRGAALEFSGNRSIKSRSEDFLPASCREEYARLLTRAFDHSEINYLQYQAENAAWWEIRIVPIVQQDAVRASMVIATDITEKRNLQAQAIRNARLASIGVLSAGVAHEINNPNNAIQTGAALFSHVWEDAMAVLRAYYREQGDFSLGGLSFAEQGDALGGLISEIKDNSHRIKNIVGDLKRLGKKDPGILDQEIDINGAINTAIGVLGSSIRKYTNNWVVELANDLPLARGNRQQIEQVLINIMLNALQSLPNKERGVRVESNADPTNGSILIRVVDQGAGIAEEDISRITEPFFTTRLEAGGTGLGLSISSTIIENHRGCISFESVKGEGTTVILQLPAIVVPLLQ